MDGATVGESCIILSSTTVFVNPCDGQTDGR